MWGVSSRVYAPNCLSLVLFFFFNDTATTEIYTLSLHDALPIFHRDPGSPADRRLDLVRAPPQHRHVGRTESRLVRTDQARLRPSDVPVLRGGADKIEAAVGRRTPVPLERTLSDPLDYWRQRNRR